MALRSLKRIALFDSRPANNTIYSTGCSCIALQVLVCRTRSLDTQDFKMAKSVMLSVVLLSFLNLSSSTHVEFMNCGEGKATSKIDFVDIDPCEASPCRLKKGTEENIHVEFIPSKNITTAKTSVHGHVGPLWVPFPVENPNPCKDHGITCPMTAGKTYTFKTVLPIKSSYPELQLLVKWEMKDPDDTVFCWEVPVQIVSG